MKLELVRFKNQKIETTDLISDLVTVAKMLEKNPTIAEYNLNGKYESTVYIRRFGSWNKALEKAGLSINNKRWTERELIENLIAVWTRLCRQPVRRDMDNKSISNISSGAYLRFYGMWSNALNACVEYSNNIEKELLPVENTSGKIIGRKTSRDINLRLRFLVMKRDKFKCCICGRSPATTPNLELHIDHIKPYSKGGETIIDNLQTLCSDCNLGKSNLE